MKKIQIQIAFAIVSTLLFYSCKKEDEVGIKDPLALDSNVINGIIPTINSSMKQQFDSAMQQFVWCNPTESPSGPIQSNSYIDTANGYICTNTSYTYKPEFDVFNLFSPSGIHVCSWLNGDKLMSPGILSDVPVGYFKPKEISISLYTGANPATALLTNPKSQTEYINALNQLKSNVIPGGTSGTLNFEYSGIFSQSHAETVFGASFEGWGAKLSAKFDWSNTNIKSRCMVRLVQKYFRIETDQPSLPSDWFDSLPNYSILSTYCPTYVQAMDYGRVLYLLFESDSSYSELKKAVDASFKFAGKGGTFNWGNQSNSVYSSTTIKVFQFGGSSAALQNGNYNSIDAWLQEGALYEPNFAEPITMVIKKVGDNSVFKYVSNTTYTVPECVRYGVSKVVTTNDIDKYLPNHTFDQCPDSILTPGDLEFAGAANINCSIKLKIKNAHQVYLSINAEWKEMPPASNPNNETKGYIIKDFLIYESLNKEIYSFSNGKDELTTSFSFNCSDKGWHDLFSYPGGILTSPFIASGQIVMDTSGDDIGTTCINDDNARLQFTLKSFVINVEP